jgi:hypothetical protein
VEAPWPPPVRGTKDEAEPWAVGGRVATGMNSHLWRARPMLRYMSWGLAAGWLAVAGTTLLTVGTGAQARAALREYKILRRRFRMPLRVPSRMWSRQLLLRC